MRVESHGSKKQSGSRKKSETGRRHSKTDSTGLRGSESDNDYAPRLKRRKHSRPRKGKKKVRNDTEGIESRIVQAFQVTVTTAAAIAVMYLAVTEFGVFDADQYVVRSEPDYKGGWIAFGFAGVLLLIALVPFPTDGPMGLKAYLLIVLIGPTGVRVLCGLLAILGGWGGTMFMLGMYKTYR